MRRSMHGGCMALGLLCSSALLSGCASPSPARISFYETVSARKPFPLEVRTISVVGLDADHNAQPTVAGGRGRMVTYVFGIPNSEGASYDVSGQAAATMAACLQDEISRQNLPLKIVDRETLEQQLYEREMSMSELVNPEGVVEPTALAPVDALLIAGCSVEMRADRMLREGLSLNNIADAGSSDGKNINTTYSYGIKRHISVASSFRLTVTGTGVAHDTNRFSDSKLDEKMPGIILGRDMTPADLPAPDVVVNGMLKDHVQQFLRGLIGGTRLEATVEVLPSKQPACQEGVNYLKSESWSPALDAFNRAIDTDGQDHRALFGSGIALEKMGRYDEALHRYERAAGLTGSYVYANRVKRVRSKS